MLSYQWDTQPTVRRIVAGLQARRYQTWFDVENIKGSTIDAMSDAIDNAAVIVFCVTLKYKESANCRLEAQYGHQLGVPMVPLMLDRGYQPRGWLGR